MAWNQACPPGPAWTCEEDKEEDKEVEEEERQKEITFQSYHNLSI